MKIYEDSKLTNFIFLYYIQQGDSTLLWAGLVIDHKSWENIVRT